MRRSSNRKKVLPSKYFRHNRVTPLIPELNYNFVLAEAVPKEEFNTLKKSFEELEKKYEELSLEKAWVEGEVQQKSQELECSDHKCAELEKKVSALQHDLDEVANGFEILHKELLGKQFSFPFRHDTHSEGN